MAQRRMYHVVNCIKNIVSDAMEYRIIQYRVAVGKGEIRLGEVKLG
jgi:hypothetical protein